MTESFDEPDGAVGGTDIPASGIEKTAIAAETHSDPKPAAVGVFVVTPVRRGEAHVKGLPSPVEASSGDTGQGAIGEGPVNHAFALA